MGWNLSKFPVAFITGITGQDGAYLAEFLLDKGYIVHGLRQPSTLPDLINIEDLCIRYNGKFFLHYGDMTDGSVLHRILLHIKPDEIYHLAAQSHVKVSFDSPEYTANVNGLGTLRLLEAIRTIDKDRKIRFYQASTSELFGSTPFPQCETSPFEPCSPYATAKLYSYWTVKNYRKSYGIHASNGILFNHESPIRGEEFVTRKITKAVARISMGQQNILMLGNLDSKRDWGHAKDYVRGMWLMLQQEKADDYVLATGKTYKVRDFVEKAFAKIDIKLKWQGKGLNEKAIDTTTGRVVVAVDKELFRPQEVHCLIGNPEKAKNMLGWSTDISLDELIEEMVEADIKIAKSEANNNLISENVICSNG